MQQSHSLTGVNTTGFNNIQATDILIIGAGVVGLSLAKACQDRFPDIKTTILEKEASLAQHASGRNSGVLHSGIYYPPETLKAKVCREGAEALYQYCTEKNLPINRCGKIILPILSSDDTVLETLYTRGIQNGVTVEWLDEKALRALEPDAKSITGKALWVQTTGTFDPKQIMAQLGKDFQERGGQLHFSQPALEIHPDKRLVKTPQARYTYNLLINTAGLQADRIAKAFDIGKQYTVLPFKGIYYKLDSTAGFQIQRHLYPVPDLNMPFLGVHFTRNISGQVYLGPTAVPAFGRENYRGLEGLEWQETPEILWNLTELYARNQQGFRDFAHQESVRYFKSAFVKAAQGLVPALQPKHLLPCEKVGIRPQLVDRQAKRLVMDFLIERTDSSIHILNAISPAFTSAFTFATFVLEQYMELSQPQQKERQKAYATER